MNGLPSGEAYALNEYDFDSSHEEEYGITLKSGMDKTQVVNHIVNTTKDVLVHLGTKVFK